MVYCSVLTYLMSLPLPRQLGGNTCSIASLHIRLKSIWHRMNVPQLQEWSKTQATFKGYLYKCKPTRRDTVDIGFDDAASRDLISRLLEVLARKATVRLSCRRCIAILHSGRTLSSICLSAASSSLWTWKPTDSTAPASRGSGKCTKSV